MAVIPSAILFNEEQRLLKPAMKDKRKRDAAHEADGERQPRKRRGNRNNAGVSGEQRNRGTVDDAGTTCQ
jgi:hypothetical protein